MSETTNSNTLQSLNTLKRMSFGFVCLLGFIFSIIVASSRIFPSLELLHLQDSFAFWAFVGLFWRSWSVGLSIKPTKVEISYALFILLIGMSFLNLIPHGVLSDGRQQYQTSLKTLLILFILSSYSANSGSFHKGFIVFILALIVFELQGFRAVLQGAGMSSNRFDSCGLIFNSRTLSC